MAVLNPAPDGMQEQSAEPPSLPSPLLLRPSSVFAKFHAWLAAQLDAEQGRWFLWLPVFFGAGIGLYFAMPYEPNVRFAAGAFVIALVCRMLAHGRLIAFLFTSICLCVCAGFLVATVRTAVMFAPVLERQGAYELEGFVESFDKLSAKRGRAVVRLQKLTRDTQALGTFPYRARISLRGEVSLLPGAYIKMKAVLQPPPEPVQPGGFDYARMTYYQGIGASGFSLTKPEVVEGVALPWDMRLRTPLARLRAQIGERITKVLSGQTGAIAAALTVGQEAGLDDETMADLRGSGLAHIISISGLHMSLVAGTVFWFLRWFLAWFPFIAVRYSTRTIAGAAALICVTIYLALSGAAIAAVRSYIMIAVVFLAILLNRPALSLRNVAFSGLLILVVLPDSLIDISFQMSFAATAALIAGYERFGHYLHFEAASIRQRLLWQPLLFVGGVFLTTLTAGLAVEPFSAYHFHNLTSYAGLGNLAGGPPVDFITMPAMIIALLAMPFGLEEWPLKVMGYGIDMMMVVAKFVAAIPGAIIVIPAFPFLALLLMIVGGLWLIIWRRKWALFGLIGLGAGLAVTTLHDRPDVYIDREAKVIAIRDKKGLLQAPKSRKAYYSLAQWLKANGDERKPKDAASGQGFQCDTQSCIALLDGQLISLILKPDALAQDCQRAAILIAPMDLQQPCPAPKVILDRGALWEKGASTIFIEGQELRLESANQGRGLRPWAPFKRRREKIPQVSSGNEENLTPDDHQNVEFYE